MFSARLYVLLLKKRINFGYWLWFAQEFAIGLVVESVCGPYFSQQDTGLSPQFFSVLRTKSFSLSHCAISWLFQGKPKFFSWPHTLKASKPGVLQSLQTFTNTLKVLWKQFGVKKQDGLFSFHGVLLIISPLTNDNVSVPFQENIIPLDMKRSSAD